MSDAQSNGTGAEEAQTFTFAQAEPFVLESGATLGPVTLAYETYGQLAQPATRSWSAALSGSAPPAG